MESRIQEALEYVWANPEALIARVARDFGVVRSTLQNRMKGGKPRIGHCGNNKLFTDAEETSTCRYIDRLDHANLAVRPGFVTDVANHILFERSEVVDPTNPPTVGQHWTTRFLQRQKYLKYRQQQLEKDRQDSEDIEAIQKYYQQLRTILEDKGFNPQDIWNMDETGFRIGVGKDQLVVTKRRRTHYFGLPENRESATVIEAISASGEVLPAFLILSGSVHMAQWYRQPLHPDTVLRPVESGYSNDEISLE